MKFSDFLKEDVDNENDPSKQILSKVVELISKNSKTMKIFPVKELYLIDHKSSDETFKDDLAGYFIFKNNIGSQDDFYIGKFIYHIDNEKIDIMLKDIKNNFSTIADVELHIKNNLKGYKMDL